MQIQRVSVKPDRSGKVHLTWKASGKPEEFWVRWSPDGESWFSVATQLTATSYELDTASLPSGTAHLEVVGHDGFFSARSEPVEITVADHSPVLTILHPRDGARLPAGTSLRLWGSVIGGGGVPVPYDEAQWFLEGQEIADGLDTFAEFKPGKHTLTLRVVTTSQEVTETVAFEVVEPEA